MIKNRKAWESLLDEYWKTIIHIRDKGLDQYWLSKGIKKAGAEAHHIFSRRNRNTRWDTRNGILLQRAHHFSKAHVEPEEFRQFLIKDWFKFESSYDKLHISALIPVKLKEGNYKLIEMQLAIELAALTQMPDWILDDSTTKKKQILKGLRVNNYAAK